MSSQAVPFRNLKFDMDWITRPVFGIGLAVLAISALVGGRWYFAAFVAAGAIGAAREWHRLVEQRRFSPEFWLGGMSIAVAIALLTLRPDGSEAWFVLGA